MVANEKDFKGLTIGTYDNENDDKLTKDIKKYLGNNVLFFCVGTDRSTGDSLAPFIGTLLKESGYENVIGTIDDPAHAQNLEEKIKEIPKGVKVLAIDASLGRLQNVGKIKLISGGLFAGRGVGKDLPEVGDFHIQGVVNVDAGDAIINYKVLSCTRLSSVLKMANQVVSAIEAAYPLELFEPLKQIK